MKTGKSIAHGAKRRTRKTVGSKRETSDYRTRDNQRDRGIEQGA